MADFSSLLRNGELEVSTGGTHYPLTTWDEGFYDFQVKLPEDLYCDQCIFQVSSSKVTFSS